jgi:hypothetical protein
MISPPMATFPVKATYQTRLPETVSSVLNQKPSEESLLIRQIRAVLLEAQGVKFYGR